MQSGEKMLQYRKITPNLGYWTDWTNMGWDELKMPAHRTLMELYRFIGDGSIVRISDPVGGAIVEYHIV